MLIYIVIVCVILVIFFVVRIDGIDHRDSSKAVTWRKFFVRKNFPEKCIELLIAILGVVIGIWATDYSEQCAMKIHVADMLEVAQKDLSQQVGLIDIILEAHENDQFDLATTKINVSLECNILKSIIEDDVVFTTMSKTGCGLLLSAMRNTEMMYGILKSKELDEEKCIDMIEFIKQGCDDMIRLLKIEIERLGGDCSDEKAGEEYFEFYNELKGREGIIFSMG